MSDNQPSQLSAARTAVLLQALRHHDDDRAAALRTQLPLLLSRMCSELQGAFLTLSMATQSDGLVDVTLAAGGPPAAAEAWLIEAVDVLDAYAELELATIDETSGRNLWPVVPVRGPVPASIGYSFDSSSATSSTNTAIWTATPSSQALSSSGAVWMHMLARHPGHELRVKMVPVGATDSTSAWEVEIFVCTRGEEPSLRLRSQLRGVWPGLQIANTASPVAVPLTVGDDALPVLFPIPVAGVSPVEGAAAAAAAPIPMYPSRGHREHRSTGLRIGVGHTVGRLQVPVLLDSDERLRHVHVLGRTGTGKSSLLAGIVRSIAESGAGALVLDPHGHLIDRILGELPADAANRTRVIRSGDVERPVPLNPLAVTDPVARDITIDEVCSMFEYLFDKNHTGIVGPRFRERVAMALRALTAVFGPTASLLDVPMALGDDLFLRHAIAVAGDDRLAAWHANDVRSRRSNEYGDLVSWVNSKFEAFTSTAATRAILGSGTDAFDMAEAMDNDRIVLVDLSKSQLGESTSRLLGYLHLSRAWAAGLRRTSTRPFTLVVDEAHSMIAGSLTSMLSEGRKFGLSIVMAHQYLDQLDEDLRPAVDGNVATTVAFRCAVSDAAALTRRFGGQVGAATLMTLPDLSAVTMRSASGGTQRPHTLTVDHNERVHARRGDELRKLAVEISDLTTREWSDPFHNSTIEARDGHSRVAAGSWESEDSTTAGEGNASFLDQWLAKKQQETRSRSRDGSADATA
ncbi:MAG: DUF87 domain-containing protein [Rhodococcus erythropolis]